MLRQLAVFFLLVLGFSLSCLAEETKERHDERIRHAFDFTTSWWTFFDTSEDGHTLYVVTAGKNMRSGGKIEEQENDTVLHVYDISDIDSPREITNTNLGSIGVREVWAQGSFVFIFRSSTFGEETVSGKAHLSHFVIVNVSDPTLPKIVGTFEYQFQNAFVSEDARTVALQPTANGAPVFVDVSQPDHPIKIDNPDSSRSAFAPTSYEKWVGHSYYWRRELPDQRAVARIDPDNNFIIQLFSTESPSFDVENLRSVYSDVKQEYTKCLAHPHEYPGCNANTGRLAYAGIKELMETSPATLSAAERVLMLNDYGFWLSHADNVYGPEKTKGLQESVTVLESVVQLEPKRTVAWLNLGDAARLAIGNADSEEDKATYWKKASNAYEHHSALAGKDAAGKAAIASFDLPAAYSKNKSVCGFVAEAFNGGHPEEIWSTSGTYVDDGETEEFKVAWAMGSCASRYVKVEGDEQFDVREELQPANDPPGEPMIVRFHGKSFIVSVVDEGPHEVIEPNVGQVCRFKRSYKPELVENTNPSLCTKFMEGKGLADLPWTPIEDGDEYAEADMGHRGMVPNEGKFDGTMQADIQGNGTKARIGHIDLEWSGGCGCSERAVSLLKGKSMDTSELNKSLIEAQNLWKFPWGRHWNMCRENGAELTKIDGRAYVAITAGEGPLDRPASRLLMEIVQGKFRHACRIEAAQRFTPIEVKAK